MGQVGSGHSDPTLPYPIRPARNNPTHEKSFKTTTTPPAAVGIPFLFYTIWCCASGLFIALIFIFFSFRRSFVVT